MKIKEIYDQAIAIVGETYSVPNAESYAERAPYLAAIFCCNAAATDRDFRSSHGLPTQNAFNEICLMPEDDFPLDARFASAGAYYIAAMLLLDENEELSDKLFEKYAEIMSAAVSETPFKKGKIKNTYN